MLAPENVGRIFFELSRQLGLHIRMFDRIILTISAGALFSACSIVCGWEYNLEVDSLV